jgi:sulfopyruvate decarboxylase subunit beta
MKRVEALEALGKLVTEEDLFISASAVTGDDWWNFRPGGVDNTFTPTALGSVSPIAFGLALALPHRRIVALDADGSMLMNTGALCTIGDVNPPNLTILILDNALYESAGGQPTHTGRRADLARMAEAAGCVNCGTVATVPDLTREAARLLGDEQFGLLVAKIEPGVHQWPTEKRKPTDGIEDKYRFIRYVERLEGISIRSQKARPRY